MTKNNMELKIYSTLISSILAFAVIAGIPTVFAQEDNTGMTSEGGDMGDMNQSQGNEAGGLIEDQSTEAKNDGNNEEEEGDDE
jgi:hypothetical protein